jgi:hypothetical protein
VPDEVTSDNQGSQTPNPPGQVSPGVAETAAALFGDLIANLERLQDSAQRESTAEIAYMDRVVLLAGGTLTLIFTVMGSVSAHLYEMHQQARHVPYVLISCWLLVVTIVAGLFYNRAVIRLGSVRDAELTMTRADSLLRLGLLKIPHVTDVSTIPPLLGATSVKAQIKSFKRFAIFFGTVAQWALVAAFVFLVLFIQTNISLMLAAAPHN